MKKLLVTGASGFIGGFIVSAGLERGYEVHAAVRKTSNTQYLQDKRIKIKTIDFDDEEKLRGLLLIEHYDYIVHNAGVTKASDEQTYFKINAGYTRKFVKILHEENVLPRKFLLMSSMASYGPADFQASGIVDHNSSPHPVTQYGRSKLQAEQFLHSFRDLAYIILRPTAVFGPREKDFLSLYKSMQRGIEIYLGSKDQTLTFIYVKDLANLIFSALASDVKRRGYFVCDGNTYSSEEYNSLISKALDKKTTKFVLPLGLVKLIAIASELGGKLSGKYPILNRDKLNELKATNWKCDTRPQEEELGFKAQYSLKEAIEETIAWNKSKGFL